MAIPGTDITNQQVENSGLAAPPCNDKELHLSLLFNLLSHLQKTGKICPKPWFWGRFYIEYQPRYESYWLLQWWQTSDAEKSARFQDQLDYLARETGHFCDAYRFLCRIEDKDWHYARNEHAEFKVT